MDAPATKVLIQLDPETAAQLERTVPARTRRRSAFIREAIRKALWDLEETRVARAYQAQSDADEPAYFNPRVWETEGPPASPRRRARKRKAR